MRRAGARGTGRAAVLVGVVVLVVAGCTATPPPVEPSPTPVTTPSAAAEPTFADAVTALTADLVPTGEVRPCEELVPGSPQAQEHLDRVAAELEAATGEEAAGAPTPTLPSCGVAEVEALRAASVTGFAHGPGDEVQLPVAGGGARVVEVYELADAEAAAATYARHIGDPEDWAVDQEIPAAELEGGYYQARQVVSGAQVATADVPGWVATVLSRDEVAFTEAGEQASPPVSYAYLWAFRGPLLVRVQVAGDEPGAAATTAAQTARAFTAALGAPVD